MMSEKRFLRMANETFVITFLKYFSSPFSIVFGGTKMPVEFGYGYSPTNITGKRTEAINFFTFAPECFVTGFAFVKKTSSVFSFYWRRFTNFTISKFFHLARITKSRASIFFVTTFAFIFHNAPLKLWVNSGKPRPGNPEPSRLSNLRKVQRLRMTRLIEIITYVINSVKGIIPTSAQHESEKIVQAK